jgi:hypothetical protein
VFLPRLTSDCDPPTYTSHVAGITGVIHALPKLALLFPSFQDKETGLGWECGLLKANSQKVVELGLICAFPAQSAPSTVAMGLQAATNT